MSEASFEFHSPLSLLREWRDRADGARLREVLVTGYTLDLVFFERYCVSAARGLGARVTVLGDAGQAVHEPVDVRHAGRAYQHGHASCGGAFHPKLTVLVGNEEVWAALGSGNPTMSGWGHNHEVWLVLRASLQRGPAALRDLGDWLIELPRTVVMPSWIGATVQQIGTSIIPSQVDGSLPNLRIFGNLRRSLIEQLPSESVRSLRMTAPYFDRHSQAVRALIARFSPGEVDIAVQRALSQYSGQTLGDVTSTVARVGFLFLDEERTTHGKLVEWAVDNETTALVGSANLSAAAMLVSTESGGNCELVACQPVLASLLPAGSRVDREEISACNTIIDEARESDEVLTLLGARRLQDAVVVELITSTREPVTIETSPDGTPGTWMAAYVVSADKGRRVTASFRVPEQLGGAVRAWVEVAGERLVSTVVFLTDTNRCLPHDDGPDRPKLVRDYRLEEVFTDPVLANRFNADLLRLLSQIQQHKGAGTVPLRTSTPTVDAASSDDRWGAWLQDMERTMGPSLTSLVFPGVDLAPGTGPLGWTVGPEADQSELTEDEDEETVDALTTEQSSAATARAPTIPPSQRQKWRTTARRLRSAMQSDPYPPLEFRMTVTLLYLNLLAAGVWGSDESWRPELRDVVQGLVPTDEEYDNTPGEALSFLSSLTAVCVALLFQDASPHGGNEHDLVAKSAWDHARDWVAYAEPQLAERYLYVPEQAHARVASESEVAAVIDLAVSAADDPHAELRAAFDHEGLHVEWIGGVWVADGDFRNPRRIAARVATLAGPRCVVLARNARTVSLLLRDEATVVIAESTAPRWRVYRMTPVSTPLSILGGDEGLPSAGSTHPLEPVPRHIVELAETAGVNLAQLLAAIRVAR